MTRVSLKEAYDNKDVVAQIYAIRDIAEGANDTANGAVTTANTASEHVDSLVPQVEGAVQTANNASASAQQSAQTVTGYDTRLTAVENADAQNVKIDVPQDITGRKTIFENYPRLDFKSKQATDVGSGIRLLDAADGSQKSYLYLYPDRIDIPTPSVGAPSSAIVNKAYVESTNGETNNLVHRTANETINGIKRFTSTPIRDGLTDVPSGNEYKDIIGLTGNNNYLGAILSVEYHADGSTRLYAQVRNSDGTVKSVVLAEGNR